MSTSSRVRRIVNLMHSPQHHPCFSTLRITAKYVQLRNRETKAVRKVHFSLQAPCLSVECCGSFGAKLECTGAIPMAQPGINLLYLPQTASPAFRGAGWACRRWCGRYCARWTVIGLCELYREALIQLLMHLHYALCEGFEDSMADGFHFVHSNRMLSSPYHCRHDVREVVSANLRAVPCLTVTHYDILSQTLAYLYSARTLHVAINVLGRIQPTAPPSRSRIRPADVSRLSLSSEFGCR